jgi:prepilin-type N-terminal cleavage/methylation domain-containing protein
MQVKVYTSGFTYIELLIVVAIVGIALSFSAVFNIDSMARTNVTTERDLLVSLVLMSARSHALANINETAHGVHIDTDTHEYILFQGNSFNPNNIENKHIPYSSEHITITNTGGDTILFEQLSGNTLQGSGTITIAHDDIQLEVTLNEAGQINW